MSQSNVTATPPLMAETTTPALTHRESWTKLNGTRLPESKSTTERLLPSMDPKCPPSFYSYGTKTTSISYPWPQDVTGLERIALSAKGDLQRVLSAFFARPITIATVYSNTFYHPTSDQPVVPLCLPNTSAIAAASPECPIIQTRQVHLQCSAKTVCTATSTVRITSPSCAHLFLEEKYAIGQMFVRMGKVPEFELVSVGLGPVIDASAVAPEKTAPRRGLNAGTDEQLWRKYRLYVAGFECDILEVFPSREMFVAGQKWLDVAQDWATESFGTSMKEVRLTQPTLRLETLLILVLGSGFLLMLAYELSAFFTGHSFHCSL